MNGGGYIILASGLLFIAYGLMNDHNGAAWVSVSGLLVILLYWLDKLIELIKKIYKYVFTNRRSRSDD